MANKVAIILCWIVVGVAAIIGIMLGFDWGGPTEEIPDASKGVDTANATEPTVSPIGPSTGPIGPGPTGPVDPPTVPVDPTAAPFYIDVTAEPTDAPSSAPTGSVAAPLVVGNSTFVSIGLSNFTDEGGGTVRSKYTYTFEEPEATYVAVHFASFDFSRECSMELYDANNVLIEEYTDRGRRNMGEFWARHVDGDTLTMIAFCVLGAGPNRIEFEIDEVVFGLPEDELDGILDDSAVRPDLGDEPPERYLIGEDTTRYLRAEEIFPYPAGGANRQLTQCGPNDAQNSKCYIDTHPQEYEMAKAISRLKIAGKGTCTGWLVGPNNLLMTNKHCIGNDIDLQKTDFQFMAEGPQCNSGKGQIQGYDVYDGIEIVKMSYRKDYTLVRLDGDPASKFGYFEIEDRRAEIGERIFIPGHPRGWSKQFAITDTHPNSQSTDGNCAILAVGTDSCGYSRRYQSIQYTCDTQGGNSGSPVIAMSSGKVIGLHHCGALSNTNCRLGNLAVPMEGPNGILPEIEEFLDAPVPETPAPSTSSPTTSPPTMLPSFEPSASIPTTNPPTVEVTTRCFAPKMKIEIQLDNFAKETRWELWQTDPPRMITGGGDYENNALIEEEHCLADDGIHYLRFYDDFGDGFCCGKGNGYYKIWYQNFPLYHNTGEIGNYTEIEISPDQVCLDVYMHLTIQTDLYSVETTWEMMDEQGNMVAEGGPYAGRYYVAEESICGTTFGNYTLTVKDSFSDGFCCGAGNGYMKLTRDGETKIETKGELFKKSITYSIPALGPAEVTFQN